ncbi:MAG: flagellar protein FlgN [Planctomycetes bacterium]|nr:flagellar protein FlgN [Planctomycetota bacterium]
MTEAFTTPELRLVEAWLDEELALQDALIARLEELQGLLVKSDLAALETHLVGSSDLLTQMEDIDRRRRKIFQGVLSRRGLMPGKGSLKRLADFAAPADRGALTTRVGALDAAARRVRLLNNRNGMLARSALELTEDFVRRLFLVPAGAQTYDPRGRKTTRPEMILDRSL